MLYRSLFLAALLSCTGCAAAAYPLLNPGMAMGLDMGLSVMMSQLNPDQSPSYAEQQRVHSSPPRSSRTAKSNAINKQRRISNSNAVRPSKY